MKIAKNIDNLKQCLCMKCPSYTKHCKMKNAGDNFIKLMKNIENKEHYEKMFCAYEQSNCIHQNQGCLCSVCTVYRTYNLQNKSYCLQTGGL